MRSYQQTLDYLYASLPIFQRVGAVAYNGDLAKTLALALKDGGPSGKGEGLPALAGAPNHQNPAPPSGKDTRSKHAHAHSRGTKLF